MVYLRRFFSLIDLEFGQMFINLWCIDADIWQNVAHKGSFNSLLLYIYAGGYEWRVQSTFFALTIFAGQIALLFWMKKIECLH